MLCKDGPSDEIIFGSVDVKTTKKDQKTLRRQEISDKNIEDKKKRETNSFDFVDVSSILTSDSDCEAGESDSEEFLAGKSLSNYNYLSLATVAQEADRYHASNGLVAALVNATLIDIGYIDKNNKDLLVTSMKVHNARFKLRKEKNKQNYELNSGTITCLNFDGKKTSGLAIIDEKRRKLTIDYYTFTSQTGDYLTHIELSEKSTSKFIADAIVDTLQKFNSEDKVFALGCDGTVTNTGRLSGKDILCKNYRFHLSLIGLEHTAGVRHDKIGGGGGARFVG